MSTTALLHGLRIAQHLTTEAASYGIALFQVQVTATGDIAVHLDRYTVRPDVFASHLLDTLGLDTTEVRDFPSGDGGGFRATDTAYRGSKVTIFGSLPDAADRRPEPPEYTATDVTGWDPEEVLDAQSLDDELEANYQIRLAAWIVRHPEAAVSA